MQDDREAALSADIKKQVRSGSSTSEIKENLIANGHAHEDLRSVDNYLSLNETVEKNKKVSPWAFIVSALLIIRGIYHFSNGQNTIGSIMLGVGVLGIIGSSVMTHSR